MEQCWRWFGPDDPVSLQKIAQAGATGVVTALHPVPTGDVWPIEEIAKRQAQIEAAGLKWSVVESIPVHRDIQLRTGGYEQRIANYCQSLRNLAEFDIDVVCYNFMPVLDWTRTSLDFQLPNGAEALRFDIAQFAAYDMFVLRREGAEKNYAPEVRQRARDLHRSLSESEIRQLEDSIIAGLPGGEGSYRREALQAEIERFSAVGDEQLRRHLIEFLRRVVPVAAQCGIRLAIHPDDPPFPLFGLPRIVSTADDVRALFSAVNHPENGLTLCAGSLGARGDNDLCAIAAEFGERVHFVHLRNVSREADGSFYESEHLDGDNDLIGLVSILLDQEAARRTKGWKTAAIPMRPDHGHTLGDEIEQSDVNPGYSYQGRLKGLAELRGVIHALEWTSARSPRSSGSGPRETAPY